MRLDVNDAMFPKKRKRKEKVVDEMSEWNTKQLAVCVMTSSGGYGGFP